MPAVSNTSPILNLAIIGRLPLLQEQFGEVWIPPGVLEELKLEEDLPGSLDVRQCLEANWLRVLPVKDRVLIKALQRDLDKGEAEAIALAVEADADWILLDEREARRIGKSLGLRVTGVLGILLHACQQDKLPSLEKAMDELREKAGFYIHRDLYKQLKLL